MFLLALLVVPIAYAVLLLGGRFARDRGAIVLSLAFAAVTMCAGAWSILQSRSSTAAIGFLFLPALASLSAMLALAFAATRSAEHPAMRWLGRAAVVAATVPAISLLVGGRQAIALNARRDEAQRQHDERIHRYDAEIQAIAASAPGRRADTLTALVRARRADRDFLVAALDEPGVDAALLDTIARSSDLGIALQAVRNPDVGTATLTWMYRSHRNRNYFLQALAAHPHTDPGLLREIRRLDPAPITGLDIWFAGNPATPADVLLDIARRSDDVHAIRTLLEHPALTCAMVAEIERGPVVRANQADAYLASRLGEERARRCR